MLSPSSMQNQYLVGVIQERNLLRAGAGRAGRAPRLVALTTVMVSGAASAGAGAAWMMSLLRTTLPLSAAKGSMAAR